MADDPLKDINQFDKALVRVADLIHVMAKMGRSMEDVGEISKELKGHFDTLDKSADGIRERFKGTSKVLIEAMQKQGIASKNVEIAIKTLAASMNAHLKDIKGLSEAEKLATIAQRARNDALAQETVLKYKMSSSSISSLISQGQYNEALKQTKAVIDSNIPGLDLVIAGFVALATATDESKTEFNKTEQVLRGVYGSRVPASIKKASNDLVTSLEDGGALSREASHNIARSFATIPGLAADMGSDTAAKVTHALASMGLSGEETARVITNAADETGAGFDDIKNSMAIAAGTANDTDQSILRATGSLLEMRGAMLQSGQSINSQIPTLRALGKIEWLRNAPGMFNKMALTWANFTQGFSPSRLAGLMMYTKSLSSIPGASELSKPGAEGGLLLGEAYKKAFKESGMPPGQELYFTEAFAKNMGIPMGNSIQALEIVQGLLKEGKNTDEMTAALLNQGQADINTTMADAAKSLRESKTLLELIRDNTKATVDAAVKGNKEVNASKEKVSQAIADGFKAVQGSPSPKGGMSPKARESFNPKISRNEIGY